MIERSDLAVEAASQAALGEFVPKALARGRDMLILSAGGLLGHEEWFYWYVSGCVFVSLITYLLMPDTRLRNLAD